mgnify:CR=1 FL=1
MPELDEIVKIYEKEILHESNIPINIILHDYAFKGFRDALNCLPRDPPTFFYDKVRYNTGYSFGEERLCKHV